MAADLLVEMLPGWLAGTLEARSQPTDGATLTRPLRRGDGLLDPERSAVELERQVRAYQPWPGSFLEAEGERLIIWRAVPVEEPDEAEVPDPAGGGVGALVPLGGTLALRTSQGLLRLDEVQPAGGTADERRRVPPGPPRGLSRHTRSTAGAGRRSAARPIRPESGRLGM